MTALDRIRAFRLAHRPDAAPLGVYWAPGRINLIGDHIDYLGGTVLPMTLDRGTAVLALPRTDRQLHVHAMDVDDQACFSHRPAENESTLPQGNWRDFVSGLLLLDDLDPNESAEGLDLIVSGDLAGGGLSSSASFTLALAMAMMDNGWLRPRTGHELAGLARAVEVEHVGTACGLMDQLAIVHGSDAGAVAIDCATGDVAEVTTDWQDRELLVMHCGQPRRLADAAYNQRREELGRGLAALGLPADRIPDLTPEFVGAKLGEGVEARRLRHVITEQRRVVTARAALANQDWPKLGAAMTASHASLRDDFEVSVPALDALVAAAVNTPGCDGARLTGAGFGGWAIALVQGGSRQAVLAAAAEALHRRPQSLEHFVAHPGGAARALEPGS
ncbi:MAG: galactokinase [Gammaproteobacteria bacterium]|nr:galactokinase [Gammaproteobacteria bacterium]